MALEQDWTYTKVSNVAPTEAERKAILKMTKIILDTIGDSFERLSKNWEYLQGVDEPWAQATLDALTEKYPFTDSFDELTNDVIRRWIPSAIQKLNKIK
jgi:hypothetical protein